MAIVRRNLQGDVTSGITQATETTDTRNPIQKYTSNENVTNNNTAKVGIGEALRIRRMLRDGYGFDVD